MFGLAGSAEDTRTKRFKETAATAVRLKACSEHTVTATGAIHSMPICSCCLTSCSRPLSRTLVRSRTQGRRSVACFVRRAGSGATVHTQYTFHGECTAPASRCMRRAGYDLARGSPRDPEAGRWRGEPGLVTEARPVARLQLVSRGQLVDKEGHGSGWWR